MVTGIKNSLSNRGLSHPDVLCWSGELSLDPSHEKEALHDVLLNTPVVRGRAQEDSPKQADSDCPRNSVLVLRDLYGGGSDGELGSGRGVERAS
jgi:hypothetical protein